MLKVTELLLQSAEHIAKTIAATTSQIATKASTALIEESEKIEVSRLNEKIDRHKAIKSQLDRLFD